MPLLDTLADIYDRLGVRPPPGLTLRDALQGMKLQDILRDIYGRLGASQPSGMALKYVIADIERHLEAKCAS